MTACVVIYFLCFMKDLVTGFVIVELAKFAFHQPLEQQQLCCICNLKAFMFTNGSRHPCSAIVFCGE